MKKYIIPAIISCGFFAVIITALIVSKSMIPLFALLLYPEITISSNDKD